MLKDTMKISLFLLLFILGAAGQSKGDDSSVGSTKSQDEYDAALKEIMTPQKCDQTKVEKLLRSVKVDDEIIFESIRYGCGVSKIKAELKKNNRAVELKLLNYFKNEIFPELRSRVRQEISGYEDWEMYDIGYGFGVLEAVVTKGCKEQWSSQKDLCADKDVFKGLQTEYRDLTKKLEKFDSQGKQTEEMSYMNDLCKIKGDMRFPERMIREEKEAGAISGYVDAAEMHKYGQELAAAHRLLDPKEKSYFKKYKRQPDYKRCNFTSPE